MINKRLISLVQGSKKYIVLNVLCQWIALLANIILMSIIAYILKSVYLNTYTKDLLISLIVYIVFILIVRFICIQLSSYLSYLSSKTVKRVLRYKIYNHLLMLGSSYKEKIQTSEIVQVASEGVEQLETYFGSYLPQFFYAMVAPITLFIVVSFIDFFVALLLFICVPLIPITIIFIQRWAKRLLSHYWDQYNSLADTFLENLQGLTTTKIYQTDGYMHNKMNLESERFRKITMKVLSMQLNSIIVMDLIAYGGAALGIVLAIMRLKAGSIDLMGCLMIILLAAEFFLPMRLLGSYFHIAMNGMAASDKIFKLLDLPIKQQKDIYIKDNYNIYLKNISYSYQNNHNVLNNINIEISKGSLTAIVGESGSGKSTIASLIVGRNSEYIGDIYIGDISLKDINENSLLENITYVSHQSYIFKGTVKEHLLMANKNATDQELWDVLDKVNLAHYFKGENGLDTLLLDKGSNLSGGQCQRLAFARALLHDSPIYIFDEATSNIDVESENDLMKIIMSLSQDKTVMLISHRLANVVKANHIYVLDQGSIKEQGTHDELLRNNGLYAKLFNSQHELEMIRQGGCINEA